MPARRLGGDSYGFRGLRYQRTSVPEWEVLDSANQFVPVSLVEAASLKVVGEVDGLCAPARRRLGFGCGYEPRREAATSASVWEEIGD